MCKQCEQRGELYSLELRRLYDGINRKHFKTPMKLATASAIKIAFQLFLNTVETIEEIESGETNANLGLDEAKASVVENLLDSAYVIFTINHDIKEAKTFHDNHKNMEYAEYFMLTMANIYNEVGRACQHNE